MTPLILLLSVFVIGYLAKTLLRTDKLNIPFLGRFAMSCMFVFTGIAHFPFADGMAQMLPDFVPFRMELIYLTGILEILGAIGLLIGKYSKLVGILLIIFLIAILPANIYAALNHIDPLTGETNGSGPEYLFFRVPLQLFFIGWIYLSAVKSYATIKSSSESQSTSDI